MKVMPVGNQYYKNNTNFHGANKVCRYSIGSLIASSSLFMLSNAIDSFHHENKNTVTVMNTIASVLGIAGTCLGLFGIEQVDNNDKHK